MLLSAVIGTIGSSSRGAMLGLGVVILFILAKSPHKVRGLVVVFFLALLVAFMLPEESLERFQNMGEDETSTSRIEYWKAGLEAMRQHPIFGIGYNNWSAYMGYYLGDRGLSHNIFIQAGTELGYTGLAAFVGMIGATFAVNRRTRKLVAPMQERGRFLRTMAHGIDAALVGFLVSGSFVTVLYYPYFWINLAMTVALHNAAINAMATTGPSHTPRGPAPAFRRSVQMRPGVR
jgi:O-antigen ligase